MQADIAIVVIGYNRPSSLKRILLSVSKANYKNYYNIPLYISLDACQENDCSIYAHEFNWNHGPKKVISHTQRLGLKKHILSSGDLSQQFDAVIILEDDLYLSSEFYQYAQQAFDFYKSDMDIAGIALYNPVYNEAASCPFEPVHDGYDNYFMQVPCSWGQLWTKEQWYAFRKYVETYDNSVYNDKLPDNVNIWPNDTSWKKIFYCYLIEKQKYFVYPRIGLSTNFGESGEHFKGKQTAYQTSLLLGEKQFRFSTLSQSESIYDAFYEIDSKLINKIIPEYLSLTIDLNGGKPLSQIKTEYLLSSRKCKGTIIKYSTTFYPYELNIILGAQITRDSSVFFSLGKTTMFKNESQFYRLNEDLNRVFLSTDFIKDTVFRELKRTKEYRIGEFLLAPIRFIKHLFRNSG